MQLTKLSHHFFFILQKTYLKYRVKGIKDKKKAGFDPIRTAFDGMKVHTLH